MDTYQEETKTDPVPAERPEDLTATEMANLARFMNEEMQKSFSTKCMSRYQNDLGSRADRMKRLKDLQKMYALVAEQKSFPFHKAANVKTPALTGPNLQIQARLYDMVWPPSGRIFHVVPATVSDAQIAHKAEQFANSYVRYKMPYMAQGLDDTLHQMCLYGSAFRRTYWDSYERKVRSDWVPIEDFVVAYSQRSQDPSMSDVKRYTMVHHMSMMDIEAYGADGIFINTDKVKGHAQQERSEFSDMADKIDGVSSGDDEDDDPRQVLEQHCIWRLPNQQGTHPAFDGKQHHLVITIDAASEQILRISLREEDDPDDRRRYERQLAAFTQYQNALSTYQAALEEFQKQQLLGPPTIAGPIPGDITTVAGPMGVTEQPQMGGMMVQPPPPMMPPQPPEPVPQPKPIRKRQICFFTHYRCFPSDGFYGIGYGDLLYGLALATNTILNQHIDGVTLKNAKPMFMSRQVRMQRGAVNVQPGEVVEIDGPVNDIRNAIMFLDPPENDSTTVPLVKMLDGMKDQMVGSSDLMSGQIPGSNQTKAGMQILQDQMMAPISVLGRRVREAERHELEKIWRCMYVFLEDDDIAEVIFEDGAPQQMPPGKAMFNPSARIVPASDSRMKSQRIEDHMQLMQYIMQNPMMQNPQVAMPIITKMTEEGFRIFPDGEKLLPLLQPQQPPPPPPPAPQYQENAGFLNGQDHPVHPDDNDDEHINDMEMFFNSPDAQAMDKTGRDMAQRHYRAHLAQRLTKRGQQIDQQRQAISTGIGGIGNPPMAGPPNNPPFVGGPGPGGIPGA